jgi:hypothetical protein
MGWTWGPCIAQRVSNHLVRDVGVAWVDNFIIGATTPGSFEEKLKTYKERLLRYNVAVDDNTLKPRHLEDPARLAIPYASHTGSASRGT